MTVDEPAVTSYLPTYDGCFVCGQTHATGLCIRFYAGEGGKVHARFTPNQNQTGYQNIVHGGIVSALLDELMFWPISLENNLLCHTAEMTIRFRKSVYAGQTYKGTAFPGKQIKGPLWEGKAQLEDADGKVCAEGTGRYFIMTIEQTHTFGAQMRFEPGDVSLFRPT